MLPQKDIKTKKTESAKVLHFKLKQEKEKLIKPSISLSDGEQTRPEETRESLKRRMNGKNN